MYKNKSSNNASLSLSPLPDPMGELETFSALAAAQQQTWSLDTSVARAALNELDLFLVSVPVDGNCLPN
jgi:hypothetical protein